MRRLRPGRRRRCVRAGGGGLVRRGPRRQSGSTWTQECHGRSPGKATRGRLRAGPHLMWAPCLASLVTAQLSSPGRLGSQFATLAGAVQGASTLPSAPLTMGELKCRGWIPANGRGGSAAPPDRRLRHRRVPPADRTRDRGRHGRLPSPLHTRHQTGRRARRGCGRASPGPSPSTAASIFSASTNSATWNWTAGALSCCSKC
jgi:hypothetical protein